MCDWQVGDLALCVANRLPPPKNRPTKLLRVGAIYTVCSVRWSVGDQCVAIGLNEVPSRGPLGDWHSSVFRKVTPPTADAFDTEVIEQMTGAPAKEPVS